MSIVHNSQILISDAFPAGYVRDSKISFTISGVVNPSSTKLTQSIGIEVYY
jgi:hypothetical protein